MNHFWYNKIFLCSAGYLCNRLAIWPTICRLLLLSTDRYTVNTLESHDHFNNIISIPRATCVWWTHGRPSTSARCNWCHHCWPLRRNQRWRERGLWIRRPVGARSSGSAAWAPWVSPVAVMVVSICAVSLMLEKAFSLSLSRSFSTNRMKHSSLPYLTTFSACDLGWFFVFWIYIHIYVCMYACAFVCVCVISLFFIEEALGKAMWVGTFLVAWVMP